MHVSVVGGTEILSLRMCSEFKEAGGQKKPRLEQGRTSRGASAERYDQATDTMDQPDQEPFATATRRFLDWFRAQPGASIHPDIEIADLRDRNAGRGVGEHSPCMTTPS